MNNFASGGAPTDELTATPGEVMKGYKFLGSGSDEEQTGTLELTGNAAVNHVLQGETFYNTNPKQKLTGTMTVNSILSFSVAAYSGRRVLAKWQNPKAAIGRPYSGVYIRYSTSGYPGKTGGTQIYKGAGSNTASQGQSQTYLDMPALNTTYYLSCTPYVTTNQGEMTGDVLNTTVTTGSSISETITSTQNYTIPAGYTTLDIFCVGGGGGGAGGSGDYSSKSTIGGGGGGGGRTTKKTGIAVSSGQVLACIVGTGGSGSAQGKAGGTGGTSSVARSGTTLCSAAGGSGGASWSTGGSGGSGGGAGSFRGQSTGAGGTNGGDGGSSGSYSGGTGQGTTTRAWGLSSGTLHSGGGGGGGSYCDGTMTNGGSGGNGGGARGGDGGPSATAGSSASANTGGGGGGGGATSSSSTADKNGGNGGSGIILLKLY